MTRTEARFLDGNQSRPGDNATFRNTRAHPNGFVRRHANLHQPLVEDFVAAVREGREPAVTGEIGLEVARVMARIYGK